MRIVAGLAKGRRLLPLPVRDVRPTTDVAREALFNILSPLDGLTFCDLYAGSGAVGIEAASRGAKRIVFVESNPEAVAVMKRNIALCGFDGQSKIMRETVSTAVKRMTDSGEQFDVVFADPPYCKGTLPMILELFERTNLMESEGKLIVQHASYDEAREAPCGLVFVDRRKYGRTMFSFYNKL